MESDATSDATSDADIAASYIYNMMLEDEKQKIDNMMLEDEKQKIDTMLLDEDDQQKIDKKSEDVKSDKKQWKIHKRNNNINSINLIFPNISKNRIGEILEKNNGDYQKTLKELNMNPPQKVGKRKKKKSK